MKNIIPGMENDEEVSDKEDNDDEKNKEKVENDKWEHDCISKKNNFLIKISIFWFTNWF